MKSVKSLALLAWFFLNSTRLFAWNYTNQELGFSVTLPDGFADISNQTKVKSLVAQGKMDSSKDGIIEMILIQDLGGAIDREDLSKRTDKPQNVTLEKAAWKSFQIDVFRVAENLNSVPFVTFNAQVPLKPHAVQLTVTGPATDESRLRIEMQSIVAYIDGPTNWLTEGQRQSFGTNWIAVFVGLLVMITGRLRISRHYGVIGTGARIGGLFILILGVVMPPLAVMGLRFLTSQGVYIHGTNFIVGLIAWVMFHCAIIWVAIAMLIKEYGNAYAKDAGELAPSAAPSAEPPKIIKKLITQCRMCQTPIPPEQQETVRTCPTCGADLARAR